MIAACLSSVMLFPRGSAYFSLVLKLFFKCDRFISSWILTGNLKLNFCRRQLSITYRKWRWRITHHYYCPNGQTNVAKEWHDVLVSFLQFCFKFLGLLLCLCEPDSSYLVVSLLVADMLMRNVIKLDTHSDVKQASKPRAERTFLVFFCVQTIWLCIF